MAELAGVLQMQLRFDARAIRINRADAKVKTIADLAGTASMPDELKNLEFSIGQLRHSVFTFSADRYTF